MSVFGQTAPIYVDFGIAGTACCMVRDGHGGAWIAGAYNADSVTDPASHLRVVHISATGSMLGSWMYPGTATPSAVGLDASGNIIVVGNGVGTGFPQNGPQFLAAGANTETGKTFGFLIRLAPDGTVLSSSLFGGVQGTTGETNHVNAVATGPDGSIYITGETADGSLFPTTPGAFMAAQSGDFAFVVKMAPDASAIRWATLLGGTLGNCSHSSCVGLPFGSTGQALSVDSQGFVTVAGTTATAPFPGADNSGGETFVTRFNQSGTALVWSTLIAPNGLLFAPPELYPSTATAMTTDAQGNFIVGGSTVPFGRGLVTKLNVSSGAVMFETPFGAMDINVTTTVNSVAVDAAGRIFAIGNTTDPSFPVSPDGPASGANFVAELDSDGTVQSSFRSPEGSTNAQVVAGSVSGGQAPGITVVGTGGSLLQLPSLPPPTPALLGTVNSAGATVSPQVSPGGFVSFYGVDLGPQTAASGAVAGGKVTTSIGGVRITFDGVPAPLLYATSTQINAIVPFDIAGRTTTVVKITGPNGAVADVTLPVVPATPGIFVITHADGTLISSSHPAQPDEILVAWAGGSGLFQPPLKDGEVVASAPWPRPILPISGTWTNPDGSTAPVDIQYAGAAPSLVAGALQINFRFRAALYVQVLDRRHDSTPGPVATFFVAVQLTLNRLNNLWYLNGCGAFLRSLPWDLPEAPYSLWKLNGRDPPRTRRAAS